MQLEATTLAKQTLEAALKVGFVKSGLANYQQTTYLMLALPYAGATSESRAVMGLFACHDNYRAAVDLAKVLRKELAPLFNVAPKSFEIACNSKNINEKALAVQAGLGFYGKNSLVITEHWGSFVVLLAVKLPHYFSDLQPASRPKTLCDACDLCQRACPPKALHQAYRLDRTLCLQSMASNGLQPMSDNIPVIYGCDICQNVCPYNRVALARYRELAKTAQTSKWCKLELWEKGTLADIKEAVAKSPLRFSWLDKEALQLNAKMRYWRRQFTLAKERERNND